MTTIHETIETPILDEVDVLVCGGGMTGFPAAIASARNGARTILAESEGCLGGTATAGLMNGYAPYFSDGLGHQIVGGIIYEFTERLEKEDALPHHGFTPTDGFCKLQFDPEIFKRVAMAMVRESGASVLLHSHVASPLMEGRRVIGAAFQSRKGRWGILAGAIVDATGDGSLAAWAGAPFDEASGGVNTLMFRVCNVDMDLTAQAMASRMGGEEADRFLAWYRRHGTLSVVIQNDFPDIYQDAVAKGEFPSSPKEIEDGFDMQGIHGLSRKGFAYVFGPLVRGSCLDPIEASHKEADAYERVWQQMRLVRRVPGFERAVVVQVAPAVGVRRSRSVKCEHEVTEEETAEGSRHHDSVGQGCRYVPWLAQRARFRGKVFQIPRRALLPLNVEGLLVGGRAISHGNIRSMVSCAVAGEACGTAASLSAHEGLSPRKVPLGLLQSRLRKQGAVLGENLPR